MKKRTLALILALILALSVAIPGTLAVSLDDDSSVATFSLDGEAGDEAEVPAEESVETEAPVADEVPADDTDADEAPVEEPADEADEEPADAPTEGDEVPADEGEEPTDAETEEDAEEDGEEVTLPDCTCPDGYNKVTDYDHDTNCALNLGKLSALSNEQLALLWPTLTETERAYILRFLSVNDFTDEQIEYVKELETTVKKQEYCERLTSVSTTVEYVGVSVAGVPKDVSLSVSAVETEDEDALFALDITLWRDGEPWQPCEDEEFQANTDGYVALTLDVAALDLAEGQIVTLTHTHNGEATEYLYVVIDGKLTFYTDSFSIYEVTEPKITTTSTANQVTANNTVNMTVGSSQTFYYNYPETTTTSTSQGRNGTTTTTTTKLVGAVWSVTDDSNAVDYTVYDTGYVSSNSYWTWKAQWITITAKSEGKVTVTATCYYVTEVTTRKNNDDQNGYTTTTYSTTTETFTINVTEQSGFHIEDKIAETGCLVPVWDDNDNHSNYTYAWSREGDDTDRATIRAEALNNENNGVNVSLDSGGVDIKSDGSTTDPITYTVTATAADGTTQTASYTVTYGQRILNPSFETPSLGNENHRAYYNGYEGLFWKTTAPGTGNVLGQDVEIGSNVSGNPYEISDTPDSGSQFAELNAENIGTLYQDMLTASGASLNWSFSHAARYKNSSTIGATKMYIVIAATKDAQSIVGESDISNLISAAKEQAQVDGKTIPTASLTASKGFAFTYKSATYYIWTHTATSDKASPWSTIKGTYTVPEGQYLTRLFFASDPDNTSDKTQGNLIDGVDAGQTMSYKIEFYLDNATTADKELSGNGTVYDTVEKDNIQSYLNNKTGYIITSVTVNGKNYSGDIKAGLYISDYGTVDNQPENILVKVTLKKRAVTVTKKIVIDGAESLTADQMKTLLTGYSVTLTLTDQSSTNITVTLTPDMETVTSGTVTLTGEFVPTSGAISNGTYTIKETSYSTPTGYMLDTTTYSGGTVATDGKSTTVTISNNNPTAAVTVTNHYKVGVTSLTIKKTLANNETTPDQSFVFKITSDDKSITVVLNPEDFTNGTASVTINGLKVGDTYTVTEDTSWSWRYEPTYKVGDASTNSIKLSAKASENVVNVTNTRDNNKWLDGSTSVVNTSTTNGIIKSN